MAIYTRRDHFTAALLTVSTIEIIGLLLNRLFLNIDTFYITALAGVVMVGFVFYNILYKYPLNFTGGIIVAILNLFLFFRLIYIISGWNGCKGLDGVLLPDVACGFIYMLKYYFPGMLLKTDYLIWFVSELLVIALLLSYWIAGRRLGLK